MVSTSALSPLLKAVYARHVTLSAAGRVHLGAAPAGTVQPYAVLASDTESENVLVADRDGSPNDLTVTVNYWDAQKLDALSLYDAFVDSIAASPLAVAGFRSVSVSLDGTFSLAEPDGSAYGVSARYRFTLDPEGSPS